MMLIPMTNFKLERVPIWNPDQHTIYDSQILDDSYFQEKFDSKIRFLEISEDPAI